MPRWIALLAVMILAAGYRLRRRLLARLFGWPAPRYRVRLVAGLRLPMRDGVHLATDHYAPIPPDGRGAFPTVLIRSPYGRGRTGGGFGIFLAFFAWRFAERGYQVVVQDTRGRFDSEGEFFPYFNERDDGLDTLAWIKAQSWFNGSVGLWGPSYLGIVQWAIAAHDPAIKALVPSVTASDLHSIVYPDGSVDLALALRWVTLFHLLDEYRPKPLLAGLAILPRLERQAARGFARLPISEADAAAVGVPVKFYRFWLEHARPDDPLWERIPDEVCLPAIDAPIHLVAGWYDFFLRAQLKDYATLKAAGRNPYLTIGPWFHLQPTNPMGMVDSFREGVEWLDAHLKGDRRRLRDKPVKIYVMGANIWREMEAFPPVSTPTAYYLRAYGRLDTTAPSRPESADTYAYDPAQPTPNVGGVEFGFGGGPRDNRRLENRPDVLVYTSPVMQRPLEIVGFVRLALYVQSDLAYADFYGRLCDVHPDGRSINVCEGLVRIAPQQSTPGPDGDGSGCVRVEIDMWATACRFRAGHAIRLQVSSGAHPHWARNLGTGDLLAAEGRPAHQVVFHDPEHPAALILPVV